MKRKIIMLCSVWHEDYMSGLLRGIKKSVDENDVELHVFVSYDTAGDSTFQKKEQEIFDLPDLEDYDGILIACNSVGNKPFMERVIAEGKRLGKQILSIEQRFEGVTLAGVDNYREFYRMVEHMITVHDCKVMNYLGGPITNEENQERFRAFCDCMERYHLTVEEDRVDHYKFLTEDGRRAYNKWKEKGLHLPDAVICANDNMAIGYCNAAMEDGYSVPEDFRISGFDNFDEGQLYMVSLSSVNRNWERLGYDSLDKLVKFIEQKEPAEDVCSEGKLALNESCGCSLGKRDVKDDLSRVYREKKYIEMMGLNQRMCRMQLCRCRTLKEMQEQLKWCLDTISIYDVAFCLNSSLFEEEMAGDKQGYDHLMHVCTRAFEAEMDRKRTLDPSELFAEESGQIYIYSSVYFGRDTYGYAVAPYQDNYMKNDRYRSFKEMVAIALESIRQREELSRMNVKLQQLYVQDPMTGLYNRFGYMNQAEKYLQSHENKIYLIYVDVDNLKTINDSYGHAVGDLAIRGVAQAIKNVFGNDGVCVRMGGDEFLVMDGSRDEAEVKAKEQAVLEYLEDYSKRISLPFVLRASMGYISSAGSNESLEMLVKQADNKMYEVKQKRKKGIL